jgi:hypothetical protein
LGPFTPGDSVRVYRLQRRGISLDLRRNLTRPHTPLLEAWLAFMTQQAMGQPTYVLYDPHDGEAFVQVRYRPHQASADVAFMAPSLAENRRTANAWSRLLDGACLEASGRGIQRVFANLPESSAEVEVFQHAGFNLYACEDLFRLAKPAAQVSEKPLGLRPQKPDDWPAIQKLCVTIAPQRVRQAEGAIAEAIGSLGNYRRYVVTAEDSDELAALLDLYVGGLAHWMRVLVHPDAREVTEPLLRWGLQTLEDRTGKPVFCNVRQYESGMQAALLDVGFEPHATRSLMVRHTSAWVRIPAPEMVPGLQGSAEVVPPAYHVDGGMELQGSNGQLAVTQDT